MQLSLGQSASVGVAEPETARLSEVKAVSEVVQLVDEARCSSLSPLGEHLFRFD